MSADDKESPVVGEADPRPPGRYISGLGYAHYQVQVNGDRYTVQEHQLVAILHGADPRKVFSNGKWEVHHKHSVPKDKFPEIAKELRQFNYGDNLELLENDEHGRVTQTNRE